MAFKVINGLRTIEFGHPGESRQELNDFIINGNKRATAGLATDYVNENEPLEHVGEELFILDNNEQPIGKIRVTKVTECTFIEVPDEFAIAEAEGDKDSSDFRESHRRFWGKEGLDIKDETEVVLVYFDLVEKY